MICEKFDSFESCSILRLLVHPPPAERSALFSMDVDACFTSFLASKRKTGNVSWILPGCDAPTFSVKSLVPRCATQVQPIVTAQSDSGEIERSNRLV